MTEISAATLPPERIVRLRAHETPVDRTPVDKTPMDRDLWQIAEAFEAVFLGEMLKHTGLGRMPEQFNGGVGERGFSDMLVQEYAAEIARDGSIGLAEHIHRSLLAKAGEAPQP